MENQETDVRPSPQPEVPLKPPLQPIDLKKTGLPTPLLIGLVVAGFAGAAMLFAVFSTQKHEIKPKEQAATVTSAPAPIVEVLPATGAGTFAESALKEEIPVPVLTLSGILFGEQGSLALINGRVVKEGAMIEGARLEKVSSDRVELTFQDRKIILRQ